MLLQSLAVVAGAHLGSVTQILKHFTGATATAHCIQPTFRSDFLKAIYGIKYHIVYDPVQQVRDVCWCACLWRVPHRRGLPVQKQVRLSTGKSTLPPLPHGHSRLVHAACGQLHEGAATPTLAAIAASGGALPVAVPASPQPAIAAVDNTPFHRCNVCAEHELGSSRNRFSSYHGLRSHFRKFHGYNLAEAARAAACVIPKPRLPCAHCSVTFSDPSNLRRHVKRQHRLLVTAATATGDSAHSTARSGGGGSSEGAAGGSVEAANPMHGDSGGVQRSFNVGGGISGSCTGLNRAGVNTRNVGEVGCGLAVLSVGGDGSDGGEVVTAGTGASSRMVSVVSTSGNRGGQAVVGSDSAVAGGAMLDDGGVIEIGDDTADDDMHEQRIVYGFVVDAVTPVNPTSGWLRGIVRV